MILLFRAVTLDGAMNGLSFLVSTDFSKLKSAQTWIDGVSQIFFGYSLGIGTLPALGSYNRFEHNCYRYGICGNWIKRAQRISPYKLCVKLSQGRDCNVRREHDHLRPRQYNHLQYPRIYGRFPAHRRRKRSPKWTRSSIYHLSGSGAETSRIAYLGRFVLLHVGGM